MDHIPLGMPSHFLDFSLFRFVWGSYIYIYIYKYKCNCIVNMIYMIYFNYLTIVPVFCGLLFCTQRKHENQHIPPYLHLQKLKSYTL